MNKNVVTPEFLQPAEILFAFKRSKSNSGFFSTDKLIRRYLNKYTCTHFQLYAFTYNCNRWSVFYFNLWGPDWRSGRRRALLLHWAELLYTSWLFQWPHPAHASPSPQIGAAYSFHLGKSFYSNNLTAACHLLGANLPLLKTLRAWAPRVGLSGTEPCAKSPSWLEF